MQPNLFYTRRAFLLDTIQIPKLQGHIGTFKTKSGFVMRFTEGSNFDSNTHKLRVDLVPAFGVAQPLMAGKGFGVS